MDIRRVIASNTELLVSSLSPSSTEFMYYLLEKQSIDHVEVKKHKEFCSTIKQIDHLVSFICRRSDAYLANEFLVWLKLTNQHDLHSRISDAVTPTLSSTDGAASTNNTGLAELDGEDDGESECESLDSNTTSILNVRQVLPSQQFVEETLKDTENVYPLFSPIRGVAVLVVNDKFVSKPASHNRNGSEYDRKNLSKMFEWLGYEVLTYSNMTTAELFSKLHDLVRNPQQRTYSSFVLCVLSRGGADYITMYDNSEMYIDDLLDRLDSNNFPAMAAKPKLVFIDTDNADLMKDQGQRLPKTTSEKLEERHTGSLQPIQIVQSQSPTIVQKFRQQRDTFAPVVSDYVTSVARKSDFVLLLAAFPQYRALHNVHVGSIGTRVLVEVFYKHAHKHHIVELGRKIRRKLSSKSLQNMKQVLTTIDTLSKDFYLFPPLD